MPNPTVTAQIEAILAGLGATPDEVESYRAYLMQLADMAETGDFAAARELYNDYGVQVNQITWQEGGGAQPAAPGLPAPTATPEGAQAGAPLATPDIGAAQWEGFFGSGMPSNAPLQPTLGGSAPGPAPAALATPPQPLEPGWYRTQVAPGLVEVWGPETYTAYDENYMPTTATRTVLKRTENTTGQTVKTYGPGQERELPDGRVQRFQIASDGQERVISTGTAPRSTAMTEAQAAANRVAQGQVLISGQRLDFDRQRWEEEQRQASAARQRAEAALPQNLVYTNPLNPNEAAQRQEWQQARIANGENPYDWGAFTQHMAAIGADPPSYAGFTQSAPGVQAAQTRQQQLDDAERTFQQNIQLRGVDSETARLDRDERIRQANMNYDVSLRQLGISQQNADLARQNTALEQARSGNPLAYLSLMRGGAVPGQGGTDIYQGIRPVVPPLVPPATTPISLPTSPAPSLQPESLSAADMTDMRNQLAGANWTGGNDAEALAAFMRTARADNPLRQRLLGGSSVLQPPTAGAVAGAGAWAAPPMPPYVAAVQSGSEVRPFTLPAGSLRLPGVQQQANASPYEAASLREVATLQGIPGADYDASLARIRNAMGPGLTPGVLSPSNLRLWGR